jgi:predicted NACHT family NTPase
LLVIEVAREDRLLRPELLLEVLLEEELLSSDSSELSSRLPLRERLRRLAIVVEARLLPPERMELRVEAVEADLEEDPMLRLLDLSRSLRDLDLDLDLEAFLSST